MLRRYRQTARIYFHARASQPTEAKRTSERASERANEQDNVRPTDQQAARQPDRDNEIWGGQGEKEEQEGEQRETKRETRN